MQTVIPVIELISCKYYNFVQQSLNRIFFRHLILIWHTAKMDQALRTIIRFRMNHIELIFRKPIDNDETPFYSNVFCAVAAINSAMHYAKKTWTYRSVHITRITIDGRTTSQSTSRICTNRWKNPCSMWGIFNNQNQVMDKASANAHRWGNILLLWLQATSEILKRSAQMLHAQRKNLSPYSLTIQIYFICNTCN